MALDARDGVISMAAHMKLEEFIKEALLSILRGVSDAQQESYAGFFVVPQPETGLTMVKFDVAVTVESTRSVGGGGQVKVLAIAEAGGKAGKSSREQTSNRVQFEVPILLSRGGAIVPRER